MPIRVLMIGPYPRSPERIDGGVAAATMYLSQALTTDQDVELIAVRLAGAKSRKLPAGNLGWRVQDIDLGRFSASMMFRRQLRDLRRIIGRIKPDIIHAQGADAAGYLAVRSGHPAIVTVHGILAECARFRTDPVKRVREQLQARITEHFVVERAKHVIAISPYVAQYYGDRLRGIVYDVPNAIPPPFFALRRRPEPRRFLFAGRISRGKGLLDLVQAVAQQPSAIGKLVLAGAAPERHFESQLRKLIARSGQADRIQMLGLLGEEELLEEFTRASALVLPSYQETAPMVIQQAMAAGLPVIATRIGGIPHMIEHEKSGLMFDAGNLPELGDLLRRLGDDDELAGRISAAARDRARSSFTSELVARETLRAYARALADR